MSDAARRLPPDDESANAVPVVRLPPAPIANDIDRTARETRLVRPMPSQSPLGRPRWRDRVRGKWQAFAFAARRPGAGNPLAGAIASATLLTVTSTASGMFEISFLGGPVSMLLSWVVFYFLQRLYPGRRTTNGYLVGLLVGAVLSFAIVGAFATSGICRE